MAAVDPGATVRGAKIQSTLADLLTFALREEPDSKSAAPDPQALKHVIRRLSKLHKQVVRGGKRFDGLALQSHLGATARAAHAALKQVADAPRFWKR